MSALEEVDGHWVQLTSPRTDGVAGRFREAGLRESESIEVEGASPEPEFMSTSHETGTKRFVLEDGEWVQLSQEDEGMSSPVSEEADEVVSEVAEGARRRSAYYLDPSNPSVKYMFASLCKEQKEMPCNRPCRGDWSLVRTIENGCCVKRPGTFPRRPICGAHTNVCEKKYICFDYWDY